MEECFEGDDGDDGEQMQVQEILLYPAGKNELGSILVSLRSHLC